MSEEGSGKAEGSSEVVGDRLGARRRLCGIVFRWRYDRVGGGF